METSRLKPDPLAPYPQMYIVLFKSITGALQLMEAGEFMLARTMLVKAQQDAEELYIEAGEPQLPAPTQAPDVDGIIFQDLDT